MKMLRYAISAATCLAIVGGVAATGSAAVAPELKASRACRKAIAGAFAKVAATELSVVSGCHKARDKGKFSGDCNDLTQADTKGKIAGAKAKATAAINKKCLVGEVVLRNYDANNPTAAFFPFADTTFATTATAVLGAPQIVGEKLKVKCHGAIVKAEVSDIAEILKAATKCQNGQDKLANVFGALDCVATALKAGPKGEAAITKVCIDKQITGADVGSCDPLPGCVTQAATASGQALAAAIYGQPRTTCQAGDKVTVVTSLDKTYGSATITLAYPDAVLIPGTGQSTDVKDRVVFAPAGIVTVSDDDAIGDDGLDDTLTAGLLSFGDNLPGTFVTATFDCVPGQSLPTAGEFVCGVSSASTTGGDLIPDVHCTLEVH